MSLTRRGFLAKSAGAGSALLAERSGLAQLAAAVDAGQVAFAAPGEFKVKYFGQFSELPVGAIKGRGWIAGWLDRQMQGMTGHPANLGYPYDTCMLAGTIPPPPVKHGETWWPYEQSSYFFDGAVRLGMVSDDPAAKRIPDGLMAYVLKNSGAVHLGASTWQWPNTIAGRGLIAQYCATSDPQAAEVLRTYLLGGPVGGSRDGFLAEEALYLYGLTGDAKLRDIAETCYGRFFHSDAASFSTADKIRSGAPFKEHGVTAAEQMKLLPMMYSYTGKAEALELARAAYGKAVAEALMPDGGMVSSESLGQAGFGSMHETCDITDWSWSFGYMLMASGEGQWGDRVERATFNALPGAVTKDFKQLQYFSSANQVLCSNTACTRIAMTRMSYRSAHETECCTGNVNRAMPNYVTRMFMRTQGGLAATLYGPCEVKTTVNGRPIRIVEETEYPFRDTVTFRIKLARPETFSLHLRIPEWCHEATVRVNGRATTVETKSGRFAVVRREFRDGDAVTLRLPMRVAAERWFGGSAVAMRRGPLMYSLPVAERRVESMHDTEAIRRVLKQNNIAGFPAIEFFPAGEWRYGMDRAAADDVAKVRVTESAMGANPFVDPPVKLTVDVRAVPGWAAGWQGEMAPGATDLRASPKNVAEMPTASELRGLGAASEAELVPYGATYLRVTTLPLLG